MRVSREKAAENRETIVKAAGDLFREKGFSGIGVADIMQAADLTHGGFYRHFKSKDDLSAQASKAVMTRAAAHWTKTLEEHPEDALEILVERYLSEKMRDDRGHSCAFASLGADAAREGKPVRRAFTDGLRPLIDVLTKLLPGISKAARRRKALTTMSQLVGAMVLARAVDDTEFSDEILTAAKADLLRS
ncbi:MAG TPA: TetR/AcrR family transcriptional regulator [Pseudolabrys sp.]|jgi:TetR/AcrR family transcriptional repressor of nem operon